MGSMYLKEAYPDGFSFSSHRTFVHLIQTSFMLFTFPVNDRSKMNTFSGSV